MPLTGYSHIICFRIYYRYAWSCPLFSVSMNILLMQRALGSKPEICFGSRTIFYPRMLPLAAAAISLLPRYRLALAMSYRYR